MTWDTIMQLKENKKLRKTSKDIEDQQNTKIQELSKKVNTAEVSVAGLCNFGLHEPQQLRLTVKHMQKECITGQAARPLSSACVASRQ